MQDLVWLSLASCKLPSCRLCLLHSISSSGVVLDHAAPGHAAHICSKGRLRTHPALLLLPRMQVIIAGAGGAAHLPGMVAALTPLPVVGVPVTPPGARLEGLDALLSIVQVPLLTS